MFKIGAELPKLSPK